MFPILKNTDMHIQIKLFSCLIIIIFGILPSIVFKNWEWLSRSGSLLVIFGLYIAWRDYKGEIEGQLLIIKKKFEENHKNNIKKINENEKGIVNTVVKKGESEKSLNAGVSLVEDIQESNKNTYQNLEFNIVLIGTVIWGYGDLLDFIYC